MEATYPAFRPWTDEAVEGGYYLWSNAELERLLDADERQLAGLWYGMQGSAPFAAGHLPLRLAQAAEVQAATGMSGEVLRSGLERVEGKLLEARRARVLPRDDKQLASWNGLLLQGWWSWPAPVARRLTGRPPASCGISCCASWSRAMWSTACAGRKVMPCQVTWKTMPRWPRACWIGRSMPAPEDRARALALVRRAWQDFHGDGGWRLSGEELIALPVWSRRSRMVRCPRRRRACWPSAVAWLRTSRMIACQSGCVRPCHGRTLCGGRPFDHASHVPLLGPSGLAEARYPDSACGCHAAATG
jgi:hypothetical protein